MAFGKEDLSFLDDILYKKILSKGYKSIQEFVKLCHFNKNKQLNHNVYIPNWRDKSKILVFDGEQWNLEDKDEILNDLKDKGISFIQKKYDELDETNKEDAMLIKKMKRFLEAYDNDDQLDMINDDLQLILYNNRKVILSTRKTSDKVLCD